jgi:hypothetical protein
MLGRGPTMVYMQDSKLIANHRLDGYFHERKRKRCVVRYVGTSCVPKFIQIIVITLRDGMLVLYSCSFFKRIGICHLYVVLQRGPLSNDCIT